MAKKKLTKKENIRKIAIGVICPFCGEDDFDLIGLKHHLNTYCTIY